MGIYLNPGADALRRARNSKIYVDKSAFLAFTNSVLDTEQEYVCVSRPRRFGKSMAANMLCAYYDRTVDGADAFAGLDIADDPSFDEYRNRFDVIRLNMVDYWTKTHDVNAMLRRITLVVTHEVKRAYPEVGLLDEEDLPLVLGDVYAQTGHRFVIVIDEWDCLMREAMDDDAGQKAYLDWLRVLLKDKTYVVLAYMTGILPIKKYGKHSALNMFSEFSMTSADLLAPSMGFTEAEVRELCQQWNMPYDETKAWYDGYRLVWVHGDESAEIDVYSPQSIVEAMTRHSFEDYWNQTETFEALKVYIDMNYDGLHDAVVALLAGDRRQINVGTFNNDMTTFATADDVLTLLVHLGYLGYDRETKEAFVPNREVAAEFVSATSVGGWDEVARAVQGSKDLLDAIIAGDEEAVAAGIAAAHQEPSHISYNSEEALSYTLSLGLYAARQWYTVTRELPAGKGFADLALVPRRMYANRPAILIELKWDKSADAAIAQIHRKHYPAVFDQWLADGGELILAGVSYDKSTREHTCVIERC